MKKHEIDPSLKCKFCQLTAYDHNLDLSCGINTPGWGKSFEADDSVVKV